MKKSINLFHWVPRILCILAILFISMFALDSFTPGLTIWQQLGAFFIHLIPSYILIALLIIAWKWEYFGGIIFIVIGLGFSPVIFYCTKIPLFIIYLHVMAYKSFEYLLKQVNFLINFTKLMKMFPHKDTYLSCKCIILNVL